MSTKMNVAKVLAITLMVTTVSLAAGSSSSSGSAASGQPLLDFFTGFSGVFKAAVPFLQYFFFAAGIMLFGLAGFDLWKRSQPQGQKPEMSHIIYKMLGGVFCVGLAGIAGFAKDAVLGSQEAVEFEGDITFQ